MGEASGTGSDLEYRGVPVDDLPWPVEQVEEIRTGEFPRLERAFRAQYPHITEEVLD